ncbi:ABC transporter permease [Pseudalkalibacillus sp. SCS-8]|uniref:ABC transporter permease n=1 Tax=Pseudalkalibacillus nanhaiensis TaxID=3115291 RepID=UPI0032DA1F3A
MRLWHFIRARWKIIISHRWQFLLMLLAPLIFFWGAEQLLSKGSANLKVPVIFVAEEQNETTETIIDRVRKNDTLQVHVKEKDEALQLLKQNKAEAAVVLTEGIEEKLKKGEIKGVVHLYKAPNAIATGLIQEYVASEVIRFASNGKAATYMAQEYDEENMYEYAWNYTDEQWEPKPLMTVDYKISGEKETATQTEKNITPLLYGLLSIYILLISFYHHTWVMTERANGLASRTGMFGVNRFTRYIGNLIGTMTVIMVTVLPASLYLFIGDGSFVENAALLAGYIVACSGVSFLLATLFTGISFYHLVAVALTFVSGFLGGSFVKLSELSDVLARAAIYTPQHWLLKGLGSSGNTTELQLLLLIGAGMIILGLGIGAIRHDRA